MPIFIGTKNPSTIAFYEMYVIFYVLAIQSDRLFYYENQYFNRER